MGTKECAALLLVAFMCVSIAHSAEDIKEEIVFLEKPGILDPLESVEDENVVYYPLRELDSTSDEKSGLLIDNKFMSILKNTLSEKSNEMLSGSTFKIEENLLKSTKNLTQLVITVTFKDNLENVKNEIKKFINTLTVMSNIDRYRRSTDTSNQYNSSKITQLENGISAIMKDVTNLKNLSSLNSKEKIHLIVLEDATKNLQNLMNSQKKQFKDTVSNFETTIDSLFVILNNLKNDFSLFKNKISEQEKKVNLNMLPSEVVIDIQNRNFKAAEEKIKLINDDHNISFIVNKVYDNQEANFDLVLELVDNTNNKTKGFLIYKALSSEMDSNWHIDPFKTMKLIDSLKKNQVHNLTSIKKEVDAFVTTQKISIQHETKQNIINDLLNGTSLAVELANTVYIFDGKLFDVTIKEALDFVYGQIGADKILKYIASLNYTEQYIEGYIAVFDIMQKKDDLNNDSIFKLAYNIKDVMNMKNYSKVGLDKKSNFENLKNKLPKSVRNVVFVTGVCIKNVNLNEYMYDPNDFNLFDKERRHVFTWTPKIWVPTGGNWIIERDGDDHYIKNTRKEYLYSPDKNHLYDNDRRYVFTWISSYEKFPEAKWKIEPAGDYCYLKNIYNEYLYSPVDHFLYNNERRRLFTWIVDKTKFDEGLWKIEKC